MKAVQVTKFGENDILVVNEALEKPEPQADQIQAEVHAASINPFDIKLFSGSIMPMQFPYIPGGDFAGVVTAIGSDVADIKAGDEIFGSGNVLSKGSGTFAEFATAPAASIAHKPKNLDFIQSASLPLVGSSAIQALEDHIHLQSGQKILIHGGAGGIGSIAIQLAKHLGAYVATTVSADDKEFVTSLGADQAIDYHTEKFEEMLHDFDAVYDTVGGETLTKSFQVLKKGGILVSMLGAPDEELARQHEVTGIGQGTKINTDHLTRLAELVEQGAVKPQVDKVFPLVEVKEAVSHMQKDSPKGKVVLKIKD